MAMSRSRRDAIKKKALMTVPLGAAIIGLLLFLPAGSLGYWQAWLFLATLIVPLLLVVSYLWKNDPELLERRMRINEKEPKEKGVVRYAQLLFFLVFLIPGFDYRYGWSNVPAWLAVLSDALMFLGYMFVFWVFRENTYASRIVEVEKKQKVITTGPYAIVRHPMYTGTMLMYVCMPIALGSFVALIPMLPVMAVFFVRIFDEERLLSKSLAGYEAYRRKVRYRLVPGIW
ncbi:Phospholipid methyltransferase [uncultured archaeon]|nr:Phospholipid methyltransferase [uncultured archaeon]